MRYFTLVVAGTNRWFLDLRDELPPFDIWKCQEIPTSSAPIALKVFQPGKMVDFDIVSFGIPVFSLESAKVLARIAGNDIQLLNALLPDTGMTFFAGNITCCIDCIDHSHSVITYHPSDHPEKPGQISGVVRLALNASVVGNHHVFRPKGWEISLVVSEAIKSELEVVGFSGARFVPVVSHL